MKKTSCHISLFLMMVTLFLSCTREFDDNEDYNYNEVVEVFGDNDLLYTKIFQYTDNGNYLWFDIRNEIANFSHPSLALNYKLDGVDRYKNIDLRGRLYEYDHEIGELTILDYPLDIITGEDLSTDMVYGLRRKQSEDCGQITDHENRILCERTYILSLNRISFKNLDFKLEVNVEGNYNGRSITIDGTDQELYLTN